MRDLVMTALVHWRARPRREQHLLIGLALCLLAAAWLLGLHAPTAQTKAAQINRIEQLEMARFQLNQLPEKTLLMAEVEDQPLQAQITQSARQANLNIQRIETRDDALEVEFENVAYADFMRWLNDIDNARTIDIISLRMTRRPSPGRVSVSLTLRGR